MKEQNLAEFIKGGEKIGSEQGVAIKRMETIGTIMFPVEMEVC